MTENDDLRAALADLAEGAPAPLDLLGGVERHRRAHQRRRAVVAATAAVGAVVLVGAGVVAVGRSGSATLDTAADPASAPATDTQLSSVTVPVPVTSAALPECSSLPVPQDSAFPVNGPATTGSAVPEPGVAGSGDVELGTVDSGEPGPVVFGQGGIDGPSTTTVVVSDGGVSSGGVSTDGVVPAAPVLTPPGTAGTGTGPLARRASGMAAIAPIGTVVDATSFRLAVAAQPSVGAVPTPTFHLTPDTKVTRGGEACHLTLAEGQVVAVTVELGDGTATSVDPMTAVDLDVTTLELR